MTLFSIVILVVIGTCAGLGSGVFGIGGGIIIVPALVYLLGFSPQLAVGTSLAVLLPPVGIAAVIEYYRYGNVDLRAAAIIACALILGAWVGAHFGNRVSATHLKLAFGVFLIAVGTYSTWSAWKSM